MFVVVCLSSALSLTLASQRSGWLCSRDEARLLGVGSGLRVRHWDAQAATPAPDSTVNRIALD